jgi:outer membrane protein assembly factor BamB
VTRTLTLSAALLAATVVACGGGQTRGAAFDPSWVDEGGANVQAFQRRIASTSIPRGAAAAVGVVDKKTLVGVSLDGGAPWTFEHALDGRPTIAGAAVVGVGGGELFALDARTGKLLWKRSAGGRLRGAGDDGATTVVSLQPVTGRGSVILAIARDGTVLRQIEDDASVGTPAVIDGHAFLPWREQYVSAYDLVAGEERARALLRHQTTRAFTSDGALFFGGLGVTRFDDKIGLGAKDQASTVKLPSRELPGAPRWMSPGDQPQPLAAAAPDKIRLYAHPAGRGPAAIDGGRYVATYYRIALGLDAATGATAWAHAHSAAFLGGAAYASGFALCDESGEVTFLDASTGGVAGTVSLGRPLVACLVQADGVDRRSSAPARPIAEQLADVVKMPDAEHVTMQRLLLRELAALPDEGVTRALIELASSPRTPPMLLDDARAAIATRRTGVDAMLAALGTRFDYLADVAAPPPVGPLADALAALGEPRAAPLLAAHLNDPADTPDDVRRAAAALATLGTKREVDALRTFFAHYRCIAQDDVMVAAVASTARALVKLGATGVVAAAAANPFTTEPAKARLDELLKPAPAKPAAKP